MKRIILATSMVGHTLVALAQTGIPSVVQGLHGDAISLSGDISTYGELYSISGRGGRRPSSTARLYFRPTISLYDAMTLSFNFLLSTEGNSTSFQHQINQINQLGIRPQWAWGYAHAGDFTETFTPTTLNGITIRGGGVSIHPGLLRFSALGGYTRRTGAYENSGNLDRYMYGGKIGVGGDASFFDIMFLRVRDTPSKFSLTPVDSLFGSANRETPQENLVVGVATALRTDAVDLHAEVNGSAFTRDMTSSTISQEKVPSIVSGLYTPRFSTSGDYAYNVGMSFRVSPFTIDAAYRYIGPGYNSLGVASLITDQREIRLGAGVRFRDWSMMLHWSRQNDNLIGQKLATTVRQKFGGAITLRPLNVWSVGISGNILTMRNYISFPGNMVDFLTLNIGVHQAIMLGREGLVRSTSLSYLFQKSSDRNPLRAGNRFISHTITASAPMQPAEHFAIMPSVTVVVMRVGFQSWTSIETYSVTPQYRALEGRLVSSLSIGFSRSQSSTSLQTSLMASYRITQSNTMTLALRRSGFRGGPGLSLDYSEYTASLTISQRL